MDDRSLINKTNSNRRHLINDTAKVSDYITHTKHRNMNDIRNILPNLIINKIKAIPIPRTKIATE